MFDAARVANAQAVIAEGVESLHDTAREFRDLVGYITGNYGRTEEVPPAMAAAEAREVLRQIRSRATEAESHAYRLLANEVAK